MASFDHIFEPTADGVQQTLLLLHGTGGNENDLLPLARQLRPDWARLSPRGQVSENGAPRFFRRFAEGLLDIEDWKGQSAALADFVRTQCRTHQREPAHLTALGYSNGANIAQGLLLLYPEALTQAILLRPMFVTDDIPAQPLQGKSVLLLAGKHDPLMRPGDSERLRNQFESRGAEVALPTIEAGHQHTRTDLDIAADWLRET